MRRGAFDASFSPFCTVHNSLFCGPPALVASLLGQSVHAVSQVHPTHGFQSQRDTAVPWLSTGTLCPKDFGQEAPIPSPQHSQPHQHSPRRLGLVLCFSHTREGGMPLLTAVAPKRNISKCPLCKGLFLLPWRCFGVV